jgi:hypothetical protein
MLTVLQDVAAQGTVTSSEFSSLQTLVSLLNVSGGVAVSSYVQDITARLVDGDAANAYWTDGGQAVSLGNLAAGSSAAQLNELIGKWFLGTDLPSIAGFSNLEYQSDASALFGPGGAPLYTDANQGELSDCYLIASFGECALMDPSVIESMFTDNGNGTYGVRFYVDGKAEHVTVDMQLPYFTNNNVWANGSALAFANGSPLWAELIEKAFVELNAESGVTGETTGNAYTDIANGDAEPITLITGKSINTYYYNLYSSTSWSSTVLQNVSSALADGEEVLVGTQNTVSDSTRFVADHMFEVINYNSATQLFTLYNPWGSAASNPSPSITFTASMTDLHNNYCDIYVATGQALSLPLAPPNVSLTLAQFASNQTTVSLTGTIDAADAGLTISIYDGATLLGDASANASGAWSATVVVSAQGVHTLTAQAANSAGAGVSNSVVDLVNAQTSLSSGGETVLFSGPSDSVVLSNGGCNWDTVTGSNGTIDLTSAQADVVGSDDTIEFSGGSGNVASLEWAGSTASCSIDGFTPDDTIELVGLTNAYAPTTPGGDEPASFNLSIDGNAVTQTNGDGSQFVSTFNIAGQAFTEKVISYAANGQLVSKLYEGVTGVGNLSAFEYLYAGNSLVGTDDFYSGIAGQAYTNEEVDHDGAGRVIRAAFSGVSVATYSSYEYDYVGGVFSGSKFTYTTVPAGASYASYEVDYGYNNAFVGDKFFCANVTGQSYTGEEMDFDANTALSRVVLTGVEDQPYSSLELDYSTGLYEGCKAFYDISGQSYANEEVDVSASGQLEKVVYSSLSGTPYQTVEQDYSNGSPADVVYGYADVTGQTYNAYQVTDSASGAALQETFDLDSGGHTLIALTGGQTLTSLGDDKMTGSSTGSTTFALNAIYGADVITNFTSADTISLSTSEFANFAALTSAAVQSGANVAITASDGDTLTLKNMTTGTLAGMQSNFTFHA